MKGVSFLKIMELLGLFPWNTLCGRSLSRASPLIPAASSSFLASSGVFPFIRASVWARKLAIRIWKTGNPADKKMGHNHILNHDYTVFRIFHTCSHISALNVSKLKCVIFPTHVKTPTSACTPYDADCLWLDAATEQEWESQLESYESLKNKRKKK